MVDVPVPTGTDMYVYLDAKDLELLQGVYNGNFDLVKAAFEARASVDGFRRTSLITTAAIAGDARMVGFCLSGGRSRRDC